jgi:mannose-6-phosphate isomerase-like protein (cupin superfamily)
VIAPPPGAAGPGRTEPATPRPDRGGSATGGAVAEVGAVTVHERDQPSLPAGDDRTFRLLIDPRSGCRNVTQFLGTIRRSRAPAHTHTYEEVIYILAGAGIVHVDDRAVPIEAGCSVFLPPGVPHCLENVAAEPLRLLGVFSPAGSPADKREG